MTLLETQPDPTCVPKPQHGRRGSLPPGSPPPADPLDRVTSPTDGRRDGPDLARTLRKILGSQRKDLAMLRLSLRRILNPPADAPPEPPVTGDEGSNGHSHPANNGKSKRAARAVKSSDPDPRVPTAAEFSHLVTAAARLHEAERETFGPLSLELKVKPDPDQVDHEKLSRLSKPELIELCRDNGIIPPDLCDP